MKYLIEDTILKNTANAIREKKQTAEKIKPENFDDEILSISGSEDLEDVLNAQDQIINNQGTGIIDIENALENVGQNTFNIKIDGTMLDTNPSTSSSSYMLNKMITEINVDWTGVGSNWTSTAYMFYNCNNLKKIDSKGLDTHNVTNMAYMFAAGGNSGTAEEIHLDTLDTSKVTNINYMFSGHRTLKKIYMKNFDPSKITTFTNMFNYVPNTCEITTNQIMANWLNENFTAYTNIKIVKADWEV